ncbi:MAG: (2Fe-2S)-binding protein [Jatrophihabitans sp.]
MCPVPSGPLPPGPVPPGPLPGPVPPGRARPDASPIEAALLDVAALGGFVAVDTHRATTPLTGNWAELAELISSPAVLLGRIAMIQATLARNSGRPPSAVELRVAASITHQGLATRVLSPALAVAVTSGLLLDVGWHRLRWQPGFGGAFPLSIQLDPPAGEPELGELAGRFAAHILRGPMAELATAVQACCRLAPAIITGNLASAINGAATSLVRQRPAQAARAFALTRAILAEPVLAVQNPVAGPGFRRRSCCLLYRASAGGRAALCPDCVLGGR